MVKEPYNFFGTNYLPQQDFWTINSICSPWITFVTLNHQGIGPPGQKQKTPKSGNNPSLIWNNISPTWIFPEINMGISRNISYLLGGEVLWGRNNLTKYILCNCFSPGESYDRKTLFMKAISLLNCCSLVAQLNFSATSANMSTTVLNYHFVNVPLWYTHRPTTQPKKNIHKTWSSHWTIFVE